ncbi:hypothetical protein JHK85_024128 [Glycine max]|nr:hypothetical protein JHK85_024128 [Glycine max]
MESTSSKVNVPNSRQLSKQLLFDRRYGWVIDEWKDPAEEALDGGRGINLSQKASEKPELFSHQMLQSALDDGVKSFMTSLKNVGSKGFILNKNSQSQAFNNPSHSLTGSNE